jgi:hypothetical protein
MSKRLHISPPSRRGKIAGGIASLDACGHGAYPREFRAQFRFSAVTVGATGNRRPAGVTAKPETVARPMNSQPFSGRVSVKCDTQPGDLIFRERIQGYKTRARTPGSRPPASWDRCEIRG